MCGIAGVLLAPNEIDLDMRQLATDLLLGIEHRGKDATGAAWREDSGRMRVQKDAITAKEFVGSLTLDPDARVTILHTRAQTQGSHRDCNNNHPVITGNIVGVHNGGVWNDDQIFRDLGVPRIGEVDTEAIFAAICYGQPKMATTLTGVLGKISGSAAIAWMNMDEAPGLLHVSRVSGTPLWWAQSKKGSFLFGSEKDVIEKAMRNADLEVDEIKSMPEGQYLRVRNGMIETVENFRPFTRASTTTITRTYPARPPWMDAELTEPYLEETMHGALEMALVKPFAPQHHLTGEVYESQYSERERQIEEWLGSQPEELSDGDVIALASTAGAFLRPGDWVETSFAYSKDVKAQIFCLPDRFSNSDSDLYMLKVFYASGPEVAIVARKVNEFKPIPDPTLKDKD